LRKTKPLALTASLLIAVFVLLQTRDYAAFAAFSTQPPIDATTFYVGAIGQPRRVDPARAYDTASGELIMNVYEPLIFFSDEKLMPQNTANVSQIGFSDLSAFEPTLATALPTITTDPITNITSWTFTIKSGIPFHDWAAANGTVISRQIMTAEDVEYSFKKMLVQDMFGGPSWMFALPLTGHMFYSDIDTNSSTNTIEPVGVDGAGERLVRALIDAAIVRVGNQVTLNMLPGEAWPETAFGQVLAQSWGSVTNEAFSVEHGCWNGNFYDGWSTDYRWMPSKSYGPLDQYYAAKSKYPAGNPDVPNMCGTGPYKFTYWNKPSAEWRIDKFDAHWRGWSGTHLNTIISKSVPEWTMRKTDFLLGEYDTIPVPRTSVSELLDPSDPSGYTPLQGINMYYGAPSLSIEVMLFCFDVNPECGG
jgi:peptide/nickel transport system substrate-binding protein